MTSEEPFTMEFRREFTRRWYSRRLTGWAVALIRLVRRIALSPLSWLAIILVPVLHGLGVAVPPWALWGWVMLIGVNVAANLYDRGAILQAFQRRLGVVAGSLVGNIDNLTTTLLQSSTHRIRAEDAQLICVGLLHRIRELTQLVLAPLVDVRLRATLAVPLFDSYDVPIAVQVWCYDEPYHDRRWSRIPMGMPGSPTAFSHRRIEVINDLHALKDIGELSDRSFRSILSIPVTVGGPAGTSAAVVSIDASAPHFFTPERIEKLLPFVMPVVACVALVFVSLDSDARFRFGNSPVAPESTSPVPSSSESSSPGEN